MQACGYPRLADHQAQHAEFVQKLLELNRTYDPTDPHLLEETLDFLKHWYLGHIMQSDMDYVPFLKRNQDASGFRAILFDFGNVLYRFDNQKFLTGLSQLCGKPPEELDQAIYKDSTLMQDYESGNLKSPAFLQSLSDLCGTSLSKEALLPIYTGIFTQIQAMLDLVRHLKPSYKLGLVSNTSPWHAEHVIRTSDVFSLFDAVTLSFEVGASKPDPRLFEDAVSQLGLLPEQCIYIDDMAPFAEAATAHHLHGITYLSPVSLMAELRRLHIEF